MHEPRAGDRRAVVLDGHAFDPSRRARTRRAPAGARGTGPGEVRLDLLGGPDPQAVERAVHRAPRHLEVGQAFAGRVRRQDAFGQVPELLDALAAGDHDRARRPQEPEHPVHVAFVRPAARAPRLPRHATGDPAREHRPLAPDLRRDGTLELGVGGHPVPAAAVPRRPVVAQVLPHRTRRGSGGPRRGRWRPRAPSTRRPSGRATAAGPGAWGRTRRPGSRAPGAGSAPRPRSGRAARTGSSGSRRARPVGSSGAACPRGAAPRRRDGAPSSGRSFGACASTGQASLVPMPHVTPTLRQYPAIISTGARLSSSSTGEAPNESVASPVQTSEPSQS